MLHSFTPFPSRHRTSSADSQTPSGRPTLSAVRWPDVARLKPATLVPLALSALLFFASCSARPGSEDVKRVREQFLQLRFQAGLSTEYRGKTDRELFEMACKNARVQCPQVLEMLKSQDPEFYAKLQDGQTR